MEPGQIKNMMQMYVWGVHALGYANGGEYQANV